jgi:hypothetical protein
MNKLTAPVALVGGRLLIIAYESGPLHEIFTLMEVSGGRNIARSKNSKTHSIRVDQGSLHIMYTSESASPAPPPPTPIFLKQLK